MVTLSLPSHTRTQVFNKYRYNHSCRKLVVVKAAKKTKKVDEVEEEPKVETLEGQQRTREEQIELSIKVVNELNKNFGAGTAARFVEAPQELDRITTGDPYLDYATGGGWPKGRVIEIFGPNSTGKSTLALLSIAACQRNGGVCVYLDVENALDPRYATKLGIDPDTLTVIRPDCGEMALDAVIDSAACGVDLIVVDSVSALVSKTELQGEVSDASMASQARMMSKALRTIVPHVSKSGSVVIFTNQLRNKIGAYGNPEITCGGVALPYYASIRVDLRNPKADAIKDGDKIIGQKIKAKCVKNKVCFPQRVAYLTLYFGERFDTVMSLLEACEDVKLVKKAGSWYSTEDGIKLAQGKDKTADKIRESPGLYQSLLEGLKERTKQFNGDFFPVESELGSEEEEYVLDEME